MVAGARIFQLGIVNAGAVSGGAYAAGVLDFLFEALDEWSKKKAQQAKDLAEGKSPGDPVPDHDVAVKAFAGTSAGAICNALGAIYPSGELAPVRDLVGPDGKPQPPKNATKNSLYKTWVSDIDITKLLDTSDVKDATQVFSVLNSEPLAGIAASLIDRATATSFAQAPRPWLSDCLHLYFCTTNLRGVPYRITMQGLSPNLRGHRMVTHADYYHFKVTGIGAASLGATDEPALWLTPPGPANKETWKAIADAALASSAFPVGLATRQSGLASSFYSLRPWQVPGPDGKIAIRTISPADTLDDPFNAWCIDGGVINNEPLEYARRALAGFDGRNARNAEDADKAVLMIDPFPDDEGRDTGFGDQPGPIAGLLGTLFASIATNRFKPAELALALDEDVYSRFLIAPAEGGKDGTLTGSRAIAGGGLGGFAGFLDESVRAHDFQLGRRNCQKFLTDHFVLHASNRIVSPWLSHAGAATADKYRPRQRQPNGEALAGPDPDFLQIIPLCGTARDEVRPCTWPTLSDQRVTTIEQQLEQRLGAVFKLIVDSFGKEETPAHMSWLETIWDDVKGLGRDVAKAGASKLLTVIAMEYARQAIDKYRQAWQV